LVHWVPQAPQLVALVVMSVSHPLLGLPSQSAQPAEHVGAHAPALQLVEPWALEQEVPHAPQFAVVVRLVSQPSEANPLQLPYPGLQEIEQAPNEQDGVPLVELHTVLQPPQLLTLVCVLVSQPLLGLLSQLA
jgi:hypothetical protein